MTSPGERRPGASRPITTINESEWQAAVASHRRKAPAEFVHMHELLGDVHKALNRDKVGEGGEVTLIDGMSLNSESAFPAQARSLSPLPAARLSPYALPPCIR